MSKRAITKAVLIAGTFSLALSPVVASVAAAQDQGYPPQGNYPQQGDPQQGNYPPQGYQDNGPPPGDMPPPPGYDGSQPPPPPPGYQGGPDPAQQQLDQRYAYEAQQWASQYCVKSHGDAAAGAVVGGLLGAIVGGGLGGRHDRGGGSFAGAVVGAGAGAAIAGSSSGGTSPGCPPGYVVRGGAPAYSYGPAGYYYGAPGWYQPWVFVGGNWIFRPYPYHNWYWHRYHGGWGGRGGYHRHY